MSCVTLRIQVLASTFASAFVAIVALPAHAEQLLVISEPGATGSERIEARADAGVRFGQRLAPGIDLVTVPVGHSAGSALAALSGAPAVRAVERDRPIAAEGLVDPLFNLQWALRNDGSFANPEGTIAGADIDVTDAWLLSRGEGALIAVTDTGIDIDHPDLVDTIEGGWDYVDSDDDFDDDNGHGTHIAGIAAAHQGNGLGVAGVAPGARLLGQRVLDDDGNGDTAAELAAFGDAAGQGARIVNASFGSPAYSEAERQVIEDASSTLFVAASGNSGVDIDRSARYPCALKLPNLICVGASTSADRRAPFSNYGRSTVDLFAPGKDIASTWKGGGYALDSGTSMAAPAVAATAALVIARYPQLEPAEVKRAILDGADRPSALAGLSASGGRLNALGALTKAESITVDRRTQADAQADVLSTTTTAVPPAPVAPEPPVAEAKLVSMRLQGSARTKGKSATLTVKLTKAAKVGVALQMRKCSKRRCRWVQQRKLTVKATATLAHLALRGRTPKAGTWRALANVGGVQRAIKFKVKRG